MERLTIRNSDGTVSQPVTTSISSAFSRLAMYEDIGLSPEEIVERLNGASEIVDSEWVVFKDEDGRIKKKCGNCGNQISRSARETAYCGACGARMNVVQS